jgi:hypothetical protein
MTCDHQTCRDCPNRPKSDLKAAPFEGDLAMRSLEYAAVRLGMHWNCENVELDAAVIPDITELQKCRIGDFACGCRPENNGGVGSCGKALAPIIIGS